MLPHVAFAAQGRFLWPHFTHEVMGHRARKRGVLKPSFFFWQLDHISLFVTANQALKRKYYLYTVTIYLEASRAVHFLSIAAHHS